VHCGALWKNSAKCNFFLFVFKYKRH
jgi:hypothetical protein